MLLLACLGAAEEVVSHLHARTVLETALSLEVMDSDSVDGYLLQVSRGASEV
jgi:hypothetical protein